MHLPSATGGAGGGSLLGACRCAISVELPVPDGIDWEPRGRTHDRSSPPWQMAALGGGSQSPVGSFPFSQGILFVDGGASGDVCGVEGAGENGAGPPGVSGDSGGVVSSPPGGVCNDGRGGGDSPSGGGASGLSRGASERSSASARGLVGGGARRSSSSGGIVSYEGIRGVSWPGFPTPVAGVGWRSSVGQRRHRVSVPTPGRRVRIADSVGATRRRRRPVQRRIGRRCAGASADHQRTCANYLHDFIGGPPGTNDLQLTNFARDLR